MIDFDLLVYTFPHAASDGYIQHISHKVGYFNTVKDNGLGCLDIILH